MSTAGAPPNRHGESVVRIGVVGAGWFASRRHLPDILGNSQAELTAICRRDPDARAVIATKFNVPESRSYADSEAMLDDVEIDAVLIASPNSLHYEHAKAALTRGLHVLVEKPMTIRSTEARELIELARAQNLLLAVALNPPFWAHAHRVRKALRHPDVGPLESASVYWTGSAEYVFGRAPKPDNLPGAVAPTMYRADPELNGGGYFIDGASHLVSGLLWMSGLRARRVTALMDSTPCDMRSSVSIELENGAFAVVASIGDSRYHARRVRNVFGTANAEITITGFDFDTKIAIHGQEPQRFHEADLNPVDSPVNNFVAAIQGRSELFSPGEHGAHVVDVVEAAYESASTGRTVELPLW